MHRRDPARRRRPEDELDGREPAAQPQPAAADGVLALQRSAGNHAVSGLLARAPDATKPKEETASGTRATLPDIGTVPLLSVSLAGRGLGGSRGRTEKEDEAPREMVLTSRVGEHSPRLSKAAVDGRPMDVEVIVARGGSTMRIKLGGALVSSYTTSGAGGEATESWTLNFQSIEQSAEGG